jgi:uncharacterized membrane-anchored protein YjiN (DUF445 family)
MRVFAAGLLLVMLALLALARVEGWGPLRAFAEAALVGGLADWFAVTALFRRPLGLPIPHTAIIPAKKDRIADSMAGFLRRHFLTPSVLARRMQRLDTAGAIGRFLVEGPKAGGDSALSANAAGLIADMLHSVPGDRLGAMLTGHLRAQIETMDLASLLGETLRAAMAEGRHRPLIDAALRQAGGLLEANEDLLRDLISERANTLMRWTGLDSALATSIIDGLYRTLAECVVDPEHPMRTRLDAGLAELADKLLSDPQMRARVSAGQAALLANPAMVAWLDGLWQRLRVWLAGFATQPEAMLAGRLGAGLAELGRALSEDEALRARVNRYARRVLAGLAARHGDAIVTLVSATVRRWDAGTIAGRIELTVGRDLQFIRVNGTLVGGLVGLALYGLEWAFARLM